jgi:hypothetical protein
MEEDRRQLHDNLRTAAIEVRSEATINAPMCISASDAKAAWIARSFAAVTKPKRNPQSLLRRIPGLSVRREPFRDYNAGSTGRRNTGAIADRNS